MYRSVLAIFFLLSNLNASLLIPQVDFLDQYNMASEAGDDNIDSLVEYIDEVMLDNPDRSDDDEDSDQNFHYAKQSTYNFQLPEMTVSQNNSNESDSRNFGKDFAEGLLFIPYDILVPPPRQA